MAQLLHRKMDLVVNDSSEENMPFSWQFDDSMITVDLMIDIEWLLESSCIASYREDEKVDFERLLQAAQLGKKVLATSRAKTGPLIFFVAIYGGDGQDYSCLKRYLLTNENAHDFYFGQLLPKTFAKHIDAFWNVFLSTAEEIGHFSLDCNVPITHHCTLPETLKTGELTYEGTNCAFTRNLLGEFLYDVNCNVRFTALNLLRSVLDLLVFVNNHGGVYHGFELDIRELRVNAEKA